MCVDTGDAWACGLWAQGIMLPHPDEAEKPAGVWLNKGISSYSQGRFSEAIQAYDMSINLNPQSAEALNNKGVALSHQGKYDEAIQAYDTAINLNPQLAEPWGNKGDSLKALLRYDEAIQSYNKAIELNPHWAGPWIGIGLALNDEANANHDKTKIELSNNAYNTAIALDSQNALAWYGKGDDLLDLGKYDEAVQSYDKAIDLGQNAHQNILPDAWGHKAIALQRLNRIADSNAAFAKAKELGYKGNAIDNQDSYNNGVNYEEALQGINNALNDTPNDAAGWDLKGDDLNHLGRYDESLQALDKSIELRPNDGFTWYHKGETLNNLGRYDEANEAFAKAKELGYKG